MNTFLTYLFSNKNITNLFMGILGFVAMAFLSYYFFDGSELFIQIIVFCLIGMVYQLHSYLINASLDYFYPWDTTPNRIYYNMVAYFVVMLALSILMSWQVNNLFITGPKPSLSTYLGSRVGVGSVLFYFSVSLLFTFFFHAKGFYEELLKVQMKEQALIEAKNKSEINSLKNQLNPHFLFNNLSVLHSLIEEDPKLAQDFTEKITTNYRDVMNAQQKEINSIEDELKIVENYLELLNIRLGNVIQLNIDSGLIQEKTILPLSLQMAIENAVKHNIATSEDPLNIHIYPEKEYVVVENSLLPKKALNSNKMGLENLRKRYDLYHKTLQIEKTPTQFIMKIPYLT